MRLSLVSLNVWVDVALEISFVVLLALVVLLAMVVAGLAELGRDKLVSCELEVRGTTFLSATINKKKKLISTNSKKSSQIDHVPMYEYSFIVSG